MQHPRHAPVANQGCRARLDALVVVAPRGAPPPGIVETGQSLRRHGTVRPPQPGPARQHRVRLEGVADHFVGPDPTGSRRQHDEVLAGGGGNRGKADSEDALLICPVDRAQEVGRVVRELQRQGREDLT